MFRRSPPRPRVSGATLRRVTTAAAAFAIAGCDASLTDPAARRPPAGPTHDEMASALLGSTTLNAPGATDWRAFATIPEYEWVVVRATGNVTATKNPACDYPCGAANPVPAFDSEPSPYGPVQVQMAQFAAGIDPVPLRSAGGGAGGDAVGLQHRVGAGTMSTHLNISNPKGKDANGTFVPVWIVTGSYTVTSTRVPSPLAVTEGGAAADGTRSYSVRPLYGLQLMNPVTSYAPLGDAEWYFVPGDTASPLAGRYDPPQVIAACHQKLTCDYRPTGPGRVEVHAFAERKRAGARSALTTRQTMLAVECRPDTLVVGNATSCTATAGPAGVTFAVQSWHFAGDSLGVTADTTGDVKTWTFKPSVCGTVTVNALVDGALQTANTHVEVVCNFLQHLSSDSVCIYGRCSQPLNDVVVQRAMREYWAASNPQDQDIANRKEQGGYIVRDSAGNLSVVPMSSNFSPNVCFAKENGADVSAIWNSGKQVIGVIHTHPHTQGATPPPNCHIESTDELGDPVFGDGPSSGDYDAVNTAGWDIPTYIVDFRHVHGIRPGQHAGPGHVDRRNLNCP